MIWQPHPWSLSLSVTWGSGGATCLASSRVVAWDTIPGSLLPAVCTLVRSHYLGASFEWRFKASCLLPSPLWGSWFGSFFHEFRQPSAQWPFHSPVFPFLLKLVPANTNLRPFQAETSASLKSTPPSFTASSVVKVALKNENQGTILNFLGPHGLSLHCQ